MDGKATSMVFFGTLFSLWYFLLLLAFLTLPYLQQFGTSTTSICAPPIPYIVALCTMGNW